jgi:microcystin-dependent protein
LPIHQGTGFVLAQTGGAEQITLTVQQIPGHSHALMASQDNAGGSAVASNVTGQVGATQIYREVAPAVALSAAAVGNTGGSQPHSNFQPYLCVDFIISLFGIFPSPT